MDLVPAPRELLTELGRQDARSSDRGIADDGDPQRLATAILGDGAGAQKRLPESRRSVSASRRIGSFAHTAMAWSTPTCAPRTRARATRSST